MAMKPGAARESWPEYKTMNIDNAMMLLIPTCAINSVCEFQQADRIGEELDKEVHRLDPLA